VEEQYTILKVIEFSSDRKRMTVIAKRMSDGKVYSFVKGGDVVIIDRLSKESKDSDTQTIQLMNDLASMGKRTLMFACKDMGADVNVDENIDHFETELTLLGTSGLEDVLQDNVAECIRDFKTAAIKLWMLTGDKEETAHSVAISCDFLDSHSESKAFKVDGAN
jgi:P-type E1-E2 ATPase